MAPPVLNSVTPAEGLSLGETCVVIDGTGFNNEASLGTVRVLIGGVVSPEFGVVDDTTVIALTPGGPLGTADVTVENIGAGGAPIEPTTLADAFTYKRPSIQTNRDLAASPDSALLVVTRTLLLELRRTVLANVHHDMHPEYVDALSAIQSEEKQAIKAPSLKVIGPTVAEDRFYAFNGRFFIETLAGSPGGAEFLAHTQPVTVRLDYQYIGTGRTKGEAFNLWNALTLFMDRTPELVIPLDGKDPANGTIGFELNPTWDERAEFQTTSRSGFHQFTGALHLRGVHTISRPLCEGRGADTQVVVVDTNVGPTP